MAACRLAQAGLRVTLLERGRRYGPGQFPRDPFLWDSGLMWRAGHGLFDIRLFGDICAVQAAGYGGGSLVYANVAYRPPADLFETGWPAGLNREELDPYYDLVAYMLEVTPIAEHQPLGAPPKTHLMEKVAVDLGRREQFFRPNLAVNFGPPGVETENRFGVRQAGCTHCGECDFGCNVGAKNTLDVNYLALAERHGTEVKPLCEVSHISRGGDGYVVHYRDLGSDTSHQITAPAVFVCAGAINSTELLLRSRNRGGLPDLSARLGHSYSGNGDLPGLVFGTRQAVHPSQGPTITTGLLYDDRAAHNRSWFLVEEGGYPNLTAGLLHLLNPASADHSDIVLDEIRTIIGRGVNRVGRLLLDGQDHSTALVTMGRDRANGTIRLDGDSDEVDIDWDIPSNLPLYVAEAALCNDMAEAMGSRFEPNPAWRYFRQVVSVHNLGGCPMGASAADGVVDPYGEVFGYPNLRVLDGAIIPAAIGANPSSTIAAVAERCVEQAVRRLTNTPGWTAPERALATRPTLPEDEIRIPASGTPTPRTPVVGMRTTETLRGTLEPVAVEPAGSPGGQVLKARFRLTLEYLNLALFLADPTHQARAVGKVWVDGYTGPDGATVTGGTFHLLSPADGPHRRHMLYNLPFTGLDGHAYVLGGYKEVWDHGHFQVWAPLTTLYTSLTRATAGSSAGDQLMATGVLRLNLAMFLRQMSTLRMSGGSRLSQARMLWRFSRFFTGTLYDVFIRSKVER